MSETNPYQSPTTEPVPPGRSVGRTLLAAVIYHALTFLLILLFYYALFLVRNLWLAVPAVLLYLFVNRLNLRPEGGKQRLNLVEFVILVAGVLGISLLTFPVQPANQMRFFQVAQLCWVCLFFAVRDCLYAVGVLPRELELPPK